MKQQDLNERILDKLDQISKELYESKIIQAKHAESLELHMKRSDSLEAHLELLRSEIKPIQKHVVLVEGIFKTLGAFVSLVTMLYGLIRVVEFLGVKFLN